MHQIAGAQHMVCTQSTPPLTSATIRLEGSRLSQIHPPFTYARTTNRRDDPWALPHQLAVWRMCNTSGTQLSHQPATRDTMLQLPAVPGFQLPSPRLADTMHSLHPLRSKEQVEIRAGDQVYPAHLTKMRQCLFRGPWRGIPNHQL